MIIEFSFYFVFHSQKGECKLINIPNCQTQGTAIACTLCYPKYYLQVLNSGNIICSKITNIIPNCDYGDGSTSKKCVTCASGYYLSSKGGCLVILNCATLSSTAGYCSKCNAGYALSLDATSCLIPSNCASTD